MKEGEKVIFVMSDAGYGESVRGVFTDLPLAKAKMTRLHKKGHTTVYACLTEINEIIEHEISSKSAE